MRGWRIGRIAGIDIEIHYTWIIIFGLVLFWLYTSPFIRGVARVSPSLRMLAAFLATALFFLSLLVHELAHSFLARRDHIEVARITLFVFGGVSQTTEEPRSALSELRIAGVGPLTSAVIGVILWRGALLIPAHSGPVSLVAVSGVGPVTVHSGPLGLLQAGLLIVGFVNVALAVFNCLPAFPMDGGRLLRSVLWLAWGDLRRATAAASLVSRVCGYGMVGIGVFLALTTGDWLNGLWLAAIGWILAQVAEQYYRAAQTSQQLRGLRVADFMTAPAETVPGDMELEQFANAYEFMLRHAAYPVVSDGHVVGLVHREVLRTTPRHLWPLTTVGSVMEPIDMQTMTIEADAPLSAAVERMVDTSHSRLLVMGPRRDLVGLLSHGDVLRALRHARQAQSQS